MRSALALVLPLCLACAFAGAGSAARARPEALYSVGYATQRDLTDAVAGRGVIVRRIPALHVAEVRLRPDAPVLARSPGIHYVQCVLSRRSAVEPALLAMPGASVPFEWEYGAVHEDAVPASVLRAASSVTIAVIDTGADLTAPDLAAKSPQTYNVETHGTDVTDVNGHGTFVSSLAAGSVTNGDGIAGFGGDAKLLVIKASSDNGELSDVDEANAIVYAVDHGAKVINLNAGGPTTSYTERSAIEYAATHDVLIVAAAGNEFEDGDPIEFPAALLQPIGSYGKGGTGLAVGASTFDGTRAFFSNTGSQLSLVAPGENVFADVSSLSSTEEYPRTLLPGDTGGSYGFASGTSFAAPEVAGAAALVMAANPLLHATTVAQILKQSAGGHGSWNASMGYGVLDAAAAVAAAQSRAAITMSATRVSATRVRLTWTSTGSGPYRVTVRVDGGAKRVVVATTTKTTALVAVRRKHRYVFSVSLLSSTGVATASSSASIKT